MTPVCYVSPVYSTNVVLVFPGKFSKNICFGFLLAYGLNFWGNVSRDMSSHVSRGTDRCIWTFFKINHCSDSDNNILFYPFFLCGLVANDTQPSGWRPLIYVFVFFNHKSCYCFSSSSSILFEFLCQGFATILATNVRLWPDMPLMFLIYLWSLYLYVTWNLLVMSFHLCFVYSVFSLTG